MRLPALQNELGVSHESASVTRLTPAERGYPVSELSFTGFVSDQAWDHFARRESRGTLTNKKSY